MDYEPGPEIPIPPSAVRERVSLPAIFLLVAGVLNVAVSLAFAGISIYFARMSPAEFENLINQGANSYPFLKQALDQAKAQGQTLEDMRQQGILQYGIWAGVAGLAGLLACLGGIAMLKLRSHGLAIIAAALTAIPCISPLGCCGMGEAIGIWALVVLFNQDVRMAFQASTQPPPEGGPMGSSPFPP